MGGGGGYGLDFGATWGSGRLPLSIVEPSAIPQEDIQIGRSLGCRALNYDVKDPRTGKVYKFLEGSKISNVEVFAGKGTRNKLKPQVAEGLSKQIGGKPRDWKHVKGVGTLEYKGRTRKAEVHWFEASGQPKVKFKVKEWLS
ncbi:hypothetical protein [Denitrobacterium detoxificans]|jgi:hypothetical protein|uniref:hypothetical protein n=1 Tax=Denitrobacterium detoxificans TaxID=79604 RepID=UPI0026E9B269|nr:hypothetical protein [Denitrobacterium detoxificans]MBE6465800.1 hypothetical protein [Denitrobacterium detoxificans]